MQVFFKGGPPEEIEIDSESLWILHRLTLTGLVQARIKVKIRGHLTMYVGVEAIDAQKTFERVICENYPSEHPPIYDGEPAYEDADTDPSPPPSMGEYEL